MKKAFAIYHTWPDLKNAEYEVLQRILGAARNISSDVAIVDNSGKIVWASPGMNLKAGSALPVDSVDFAISLHFESPRILDVYTYYALWQPIKFYHDFNYQRSLEKFSTHNDLLSCHSDIADAHALNIFSGLGRAPITPLETLFHSLPQPFLEPNVSAESKLFYVGINWERIGRPKGRYHDTLVMLDQKGLIEIYGPEEVHGVAPWAGFQTYQGELPFDGHSIRTAVNSSGICLALSSEAHKSTGIMSNRLFEGFASGAAVIATPNPLIDKYFADAVYLVDDERGEAMLGQQILAALREIRANPEEAKRRVLLGQKTLREICSLEGSLEGVFARNDQRKQHFADQFLADAEVTVIIDASVSERHDILNQIDDLQRQTRSTIDLHVICSDDLVEGLPIEPRGSLRSIQWHGRNLSTEPVAFDGVRPRIGRIGSLVATILRTVRTPYFAILGPSDRLFSEHFASAARSIQGSPSSAFVATGTLVVSQNVQGERAKALESLRFTDMEALLLVDGADRRGRFLFKSDLLKSGFDALFSLLDGQEFRFFLLAALLDGELAQTGYATHICDETLQQRFIEPSDSIAIQQQYIRDHFMRDGRWLDRLSRGAKMPEFVYAYSPGTPVRWLTGRQDDLSNKLIEPDTMLSVKTGGAGVRYLQEGFSAPEDGGTWLATDRGRLAFTLASRGAEAPEDYEIVLDLAGRRSSETGRRQHCTVLLNKMAIAYVEIPEEWAEVRFRIPISLRRETNNFVLELVPDHAEPVTDDRGKIVDPRHLSLLIRSLGIMRDRRYRLPTLEIGKTYPCVEDSLAAKALIHGFHAPEHNLTWIAGTVGEIAFKVDGQANQPVLHMKLSGRNAHKNGAPQTVRISLAGRDAGKFDIGPDPEAIAIPLKEDELARPLELVLSISHAEPVMDDVQNIIDPRLLGLAILEIGVIDGDDRRPGASSKKRRSIFSGLLGKGR
jgi:hypothetical protein